jgi:hypothetical protein
METKRIPAKPILSSIREQKNKRNAEIIATYKALKNIPGSQRVAVAELVADQLGYKYSLVMRITKHI